MKLSQVWFPLISATLITTTLAVIPRPVYKKYLLYAFVTGGLGAIVLWLTFDKLLRVTRFKNLGIFLLFGFNAWSTLEWTFFHMLFLYFLPVRVGFLIPYLGGFSMLAVVMGILARNLGLFTFTPWFFYYVAPFVFLAWFGVAAWFFRTREGVPDPFGRVVVTGGRRERHPGEDEGIESGQEPEPKHRVKVTAETAPRRRRPWLTFKKRDHK